MPDISKTPSYSGKDSYRYVERLFREGKNLLIISPYIDEYYAKFILRNSRGKTFKIISSSIDKNAMNLLLKGKFPVGFAYSILLFGIADLLLYFLQQHLYALYLFIMILFMTLLLFLVAIKTPSNIELKVPKEFVHVKLYLSEKEAINGSANLTYKGMHKNVEHIEIFKESESIRPLESQFWEIWKNYGR